MKLYTEDQLLNTVNAIQSYLEKFGKDDAQPTIKNHLKMLSPIELPSDQEINRFLYPHSDEYASGFYACLDIIESQIPNNDQ